MSQAYSRRTILGATASLAGTAVLGVPGAAFSQSGQVDPRNYPSLDLEAMGQLNRFHSLARQIPGDWSGMGIESPTQDGDDALHWQLPFMSYGLAVAQYSRTPAYRELYRDTLDHLVEKMRRPEVWDYWEEASTGADVFHGRHHLVRSAQSDPLVHSNVEYSGNALSMMALYELLYRDGKWSRPGAFTLRQLKGAELKEYAYDLPRLTEVAVKQFVESGYLGMECEPDGIYPTTCNVFPIHALMAYDAVYGTSYAKDVIPKHIDAWQKISPLYRRGAGGQAGYGLHPSRNALQLSDPATFGKIQFINPYAPEYVREMYPRWRDLLFSIDSDGMLVLKEPPARDLLSTNAEPPIPSQRRTGNVPPEYFGSVEKLVDKIGPVAAEMGDVELQRAAMRYLDRYSKPVWQDGEMYYERNDERGTPRFLTRRGNIVIGSGRVWGKNAYHDFYNKPWTKATLGTPEIKGVEYPRTLVQQAFYDPGRDVLVVTLFPHGLLPDSRQPRSFETTFTVANLDKRKAYQVWRDGEMVAQTDREKVSRGADTVGAAFTPEGLRLRADLRGRSQTFLVASVRT